MRAENTGSHVPRLSAAEYVEAHGERCPYCGGGKTEWTSGSGVNLPPFMFIEVNCVDCRQTWVEVREICTYMPMSLSAVMQQLGDKQET